jgi:hypothetical protein
MRRLSVFYGAVHFMFSGFGYDEGLKILRFAFWLGLISIWTAREWILGA